MKPVRGGPALLVMLGMAMSSAVEAQACPFSSVSCDGPMDGAYMDDAWDDLMDHFSPELGWEETCADYLDDTEHMMEYDDAWIIEGELDGIHHPDGHWGLYGEMTGHWRGKTLFHEGAHHGGASEHIALSVEYACFSGGG